MNPATNFQPAFQPAAPAAAPTLADCALLLPAIGPRLTFTRDQEIFAEGKRADYVFRVMEGVVRTCRFTQDGHRQIEDFHMAGEYFGLEARDQYGCTAEAVRAVTVLRLKRGAIADLAGRDADVAGLVLELAMTQLERTQKHLAALSRRGACERLAAFLMDLAQRSGATGVVELAMSRQEIADYLGLTIETVSRTFSRFEADGVIAQHERRRLLCDFQQLESCCA